MNNRHWTRWMVTLMVIFSMFGGMLANASHVGAADGQILPDRIIGPNGSVAEGGFQDWWKKNGGLAENGWPVSGLTDEKLEDGNTYKVQYFERVRLEYHPDGANFSIMRGLIVAELYEHRFNTKIQMKNTPQIMGDKILGPTGNLAEGGFADYWLKQGGLEKFGWPISGLVDEKLEDGNTYKVQYFERVRLEYHPDGANFSIMRGLIGLEIYEIRFAKNQPSGNPGGGQPSSSAPSLCMFPNPGNLDDMPKVPISKVEQNKWFHNVFNEGQFHAPNWDGADSWFVSLNVGPNNGGAWKTEGNPGSIVYRANNTHTEWCLGVLTTSKYKSQFMNGATGQAAINVRIKPGATVSVRTVSGAIVSKTTSDGGDITIVLPDDGVVVIAVNFDMNVKTFESKVWWGPYDRPEADGINTIYGNK